MSRGKGKMADVQLAYSISCTEKHIDTICNITQSYVHVSLEISQGRRVPLHRWTKERRDEKDVPHSNQSCLVFIPSWEDTTSVVKIPRLQEEACLLGRI